MLRAFLFLQKVIENMSEIKINEVTFYPLRPTEKGLIGIASCLFDNKLSLNSISVYLTPTGDIRLLFPNTHLQNGKEINVFYPINNETYEALRRAIAQKIENVTKEMIGDKNNAGHRA